MKRILVPLDGSDLAERALAPALRLAARHQARLHLAIVVEETPPPLALAMDIRAGQQEQKEGQAREYLNRIRDRLAIEWQEVSIEVHLAVGPVAERILGVAAEQGVDLIVLTTHGRGRWERFWLGSVADYLVRASAIPLLLLRGDEYSDRLFSDDQSPSHVFIPLDGSRMAESIFDTLPAVLPRTGSRVTAISVVRQYHLASTGYEAGMTFVQSLYKEERSRLEAYLEQAKPGLEGIGVERVETYLAEGPDVARALLGACDELDADLIAISTEGLGAAPRLLVGSVADKLIRSSKLPVLVARRSEGAESG